ncbi:prolyl aminopeptidase [Geodermatophilus sp. DSM 44513]|uniref:prolyl aminopeptidase n=1 Tax=Geodermatophilus sp. DSM 44513 TaxID=1528104 RepID=UPI001276A40C|nr:prolyl aminopeptidase [Geodermatophilus sp. DSM 44513]WNV77511.1 prolyl aminopeptidase [Geodermatophilus sp. DSM 44513]
MGVHPESAVLQSGLLDVGHGHAVHWEVRGARDGRPAVVVHGGPGAPSAGMARLLDPDVWRVVVIHQRNCGRSTPSAADPTTDLSGNTTATLVADMEAVRELLGIDRWTVVGASWGTTLGLAYAETHPGRVAGMVLLAVTTTTRREVEWVTRDVGRIWPEAWARFRDGVPEADRDGDLAAAYARLVSSPDPRVREDAARDWCAWEDVHVSLDPHWRPNRRFADPHARLELTRLVTHYWSNAAFLPDGQLLRDVGRLAGTPATLITGRYDVSGPPDVAWELHRAWPGSELVVVEGGGHGTAAGPALDAALARLAVD